MNILDIIILICLIPAIIQGIRKGFISQVISTISLFVGIWLSAKFTSLAEPWLGKFINASGLVLTITTFVLITIIVCVALFFLGKLLEKIIRLVTLGWLNKLLGVIFAIAKCFIILAVAALIFESINDTFNIVSKEYIAESTLYGAIKGFADLIFPYIKSLLKIQ